MLCPFSQRWIWQHFKPMLVYNARSPFFFIVSSQHEWKILSQQNGPKRTRYGSTETFVTSGASATLHMSVCGTWPDDTLQAPHRVVARLVTGRVRAHSCVRETCVRRLQAAWGVTVCRSSLPFARECRLGEWFGFVGAALLPAVGTCVVLAFGAMPGR